jgi:hypothetical protein
MECTCSTLNVGLLSTDFSIITIFTVILIISTSVNIVTCMSDYRRGFDR